MEKSIRLITLPNLFTVSNMLCGFLAIFQAIQGEFLVAMGFIFLGAFFDFFDGFVARLLKQPSELGKQLDSLADMVTFGVAPGAILFVFLAYLIQDTGSLLEVEAMDIQAAFFTWLKGEGKIGGFFKYLPWLALLIPAFSMLRLAKFNIDTRQSDRFIGLPTPANALFFGSVVVSHFYGEKWMTFLSFDPRLVAGLILLFSFLLISEIPLFALKFKNFKFQGNEVRFVFLGLCVVLIPLLTYSAIAIIVFLYLIFSFVTNYLDKKKTHEV